MLLGVRKGSASATAYMRVPSWLFTPPPIVLKFMLSLKIACPKNLKYATIGLFNSMYQVFTRVRLHAQHRRHPGFGWNEEERHDFLAMAKETFALRLPHFAAVADSTSFAAGVILERGFISEAEREAGSTQQRRPECEGGVFRHELSFVEAGT